MKESVVIKVNYPTGKRWMTRVEAINVLPGFICGIATCVFSKMGIEPLTLVSFIGIFVCMPFLFLPFYLNGKISVTEEGVHLIRGKETELLPWDIIKVMYLTTVVLNGNRSYVKMVISLKNREEVEVCFCRYLWRGKNMQANIFLDQCRQFPAAEWKMVTAELSL